MWYFISVILSKLYKLLLSLQPNSLLQRLLWQRSDLILEQLLRALPDRDVLPVLQLQQAGEEIVSECLARLSREQRRQVINADHRQLGLLLNLNRHRRLVERRSDSVNRDRVVGVGGVSADIADNRQLAVSRIQALVIHKAGDLRVQVNAVNKDIALDNLLERPTLSRLSHIPLHDIILRDARTPAQLHGTRSTPSQRSNNQDAWLAACLRRALRDGLLDIGNERGLVGVGGDAWEGLGVGELPGPVLEGESSTGETGVEAVGGDAAAALVNEEFEVEERAVAAGEAGEDGFPPALVLVAVGELDVDVLQWD